ncbi:cupin domain-containing protein [Temperatibacter marinus]|uniref:Cupin domain-containing protein n=1 Tax=Temperatibacter marinus TaxID=1456591 RepID=A0AA52H9T2_9PROT|nr:cupin domain-containing protein [Temperatibacter marinus]WND02015.1 cupin domain-containing protein [Temperatibacter marinus]
MLFKNTFTACLIAVVSLTVGAEDNETSVVSESQSHQQQENWGKLFTYFTGKTTSTKDLLVAVADIKPGMEIHPPHEHGEEEIMMILEGEGLWHIKGKEFPAKKGDIMFSKPWEIHGIKNTGEKTLRFVVWKWNPHSLTQ